MDQRWGLNKNKMAKKKKHLESIKKWKQSFTRAKHLAAQIDETLRSDDPRLRRSVKIVHHDGSILMYEYAFVEQVGSFYILLTEHHSFRVFDKDDLDGIVQYEEILIEKLEETGAIT